MAEVEIVTKENKNDTAIAKAQILLRRKLKTQWESLPDVIPEGEPCFGYDPVAEDYVLKIGSKDINGNLKSWSQLGLLRGCVDDGELV